MPDLLALLDAEIDRRRRELSHRNQYNAGGTEMLEWLRRQLDPGPPAPFHNVATDPRWLLTEPIETQPNGTESPGYTKDGREPRMELQAPARAAVTFADATDWAWRQNAGRFNTPTGATLLALAYLTDIEARRSDVTHGRRWFSATEIAALTGWATSTTRQFHLRELERSQLVQQYRRPGNIRGRDAWRLNR